MSTLHKWASRTVNRGNGILRRTIFLAAVAAAAIAQSPQAKGQGGILASTFDFTTANGTVQANGHIAGQPTAADTEFDRAFLDLPISDPNDPLGTARHELFHGIGFARAYDSFSNHLYVITGGALDGKIVFNQLADGTGNDLVVITAGGTHDVAANFNGQGQGGTLIDQTNLLMTPAPLAGAPIPYPVDFRDRDVLDAAFNWSGTGGIQINVVFDNSHGVWTPAEESLINTAAANDQGVFGPANGANVFTWTVQIPEPSSVTLLIIGTMSLLAACWWKKQRGSSL